jgi:trimethylamine:corrinoid methyltransferase-like protein
MAGSLRIEPLSQSEIASIYEKCVHVLSTYGVKVDHERSLEELAAAGAAVDRETQQVRFSREAIEAAIAAAPRELTVKGGEARHDLQLPHPSGSFYTSTCIQSMLYHDPETQSFRDVTEASYAEWCQLVEVLPNIDICAIQTPTEVPAETADIHALNVQLQNTSKPLNILAYCLESVPYFFELMLARAGSEEALRERPLLFIDPTSLSPLVYKAMDMETILYSIRYGVPLAPSSLVLAGGTGPMTVAGAALLVAVEVLAMVVMTQLLKPGHPTIACGYNYTLDMSTGNALMACPETLLAQAAAAQFMREAFKLPVLTSSLQTDSYASDGQTMVSKSLQSTLCCMAGADIIYGAGRLGGSSLASPVQLVIDDRLVSISRRCVEGVQVDDDTLAVDEILGAGAGGHYLKRRHTVRHCREAVRPDLFVADPLDMWQAEGGKDLYERAVEKYTALRATLAPLELPEDVVGEMNGIVKRADEHLVP